MKNIKLGLLPKIIIAIILGISLGGVMPHWAGRTLMTFSSIFSQFLGFAIPLIILSLVASSIGNLGRGAGKTLGMTVLVAYISTLFSGFFTYVVCNAMFPSMLIGESMADAPEAQLSFKPFFTIEMPPVMEVMSALILAFILGIGLIYLKGNTLKNAIDEFADIVQRLIATAIIPLLPVYIFCIFSSMAANDANIEVMKLFTKVIIVIVVLHLVILLLTFIAAGIIGKKNPFVLLRNMLPAYMTALGTSSSAASIPVTLRCTINNGVSESIAGMVAPLCATIHMPGSIMKIVSSSMAIMILTDMQYDIYLYIGFIFMIAITAVAAPGVPGGMVMASLGVLQTILGFDQTACALMIAVYLALDSFGTACNVTCDGAIAVIIDKYAKKKTPVEAETV